MIDIASGYLNHKDCKRHLIDRWYKKDEWGVFTPLWSDPYEMEQSASQVNLEIQNEFKGDILIDEFGTFDLNSLK